MRILNFEFKNLDTGWHLLPSSFDKFNLLVGASGVGKTQILEALVLLKDIAAGETPEMAIEWKITIDLTGDIYIWEGAFEKKQDLYLNNDITVKYEILKKDDIALIDRTTEKTLFNGQPTFKLASEKSIVLTLQAEESIAPIFYAWANLNIVDYSFSSSENKKNNIVSFATFHSVLEIMRHDFQGFTETYELGEIRGIFPYFFLQKKIFPKNFFTPLALSFTLGKFFYSKIKSQYINIFPTVEDIGFFEIKNGHINTQNSILDHAKHSNSTEYALCIKEHNVTNWIPQQNISSGMWRCLMQLIELQISPDGSVFLIDEFENSLGINCINEITKEILASDRDIQFIITSHHPYIINNIPIKYWKLVTRNGSDVSFQNVEKLGIGKSKHSAFMQLLQLDAYQTGTFEHD